VSGDRVLALQATKVERRSEAVQPHSPKQFCVFQTKRSGFENPPEREKRGDKPVPAVPPKKNSVVLEILILGVSTFASIVRTCPVDGFSRLMYTYTCSYGAVNFNRSMVSVFVTTSYNFWLGQAFRTFAYEIDIPKVWDSFFFFVHNRISVLRVKQ